jgi:hypothetical protein
VTATTSQVRGAIALLILTQGLVHLNRYFTGFSAIPVIGETFLLNTALSVVVAFLLVTRRSFGLTGAIALSAGSLMAFALSRTIGLFGYISTTTGPAEIIALTAEVAVLLLLMGVGIRSRGPRELLTS